MTLLIKTEQELKTEFEIPGFVEKTIAQLNKDLIGLTELTLAPINLNNQDLLEDLIQKLSEIIETIATNGQLAQFLYRVDLSENEANNSSHSGDWNLLAFYIIRREAQKIYLRNKFSNIS